MAQDDLGSTDHAFQDPQHHGDVAAAALVNQAKSIPLNDGVQTAELLSMARAADPLNHEAQLLLERVHQIFVPRWHFSMLGDAVRNAAYAQAITATVKPGDIVLDIGCGAGLTAMLAARAGARHVYTCEQQPLIAQAAVRVIAENGLSDRITVIPKMSHELVVGQDLPEPADVVVSEIVDTVLLGEGALATLDHAMRVLAKPGAPAIPEAGTLQAQLVESEALFKLWRPSAAEGFKLGAFHRFASLAQITPNDFAALNIRACGPAEELFSFDFRRPDLQPGKAGSMLEARRDCTLHAVLVSFIMDLSPGVQLTNDLSSGGHWGRTAFLLNKPEEAASGHKLRVTAQHDTTALSLAINGVPRDETEAPMPAHAMPPAFPPPQFAAQTVN